MKFLIASCLLVGVFAELPRFRPARFRSQRQQLAPTTTDSPTEATTDSASGPYPPSGWRPAGEPFTLPKQTAPENAYGPPQQNAPYPAAGFKPDQPFTLPNEAPATSYGVPDNSYGPPENQYGPPANTYGAPVTDNSDAETTENPQAEKIEGPEVQKSVGTYYVLLPNGELQKVVFMTENDVQNMKYSARLQYPSRDRAPLLLLRP